MPREYCEYLLSKNPKNDNMFCDLPNSGYTKQMFREEIKDGIQLYALVNNTSSINYPEIMIDVANEFFCLENIFFGKNPDWQMEQLYYNTRENLINETINLRNGREVSYDNMYEIFNNICIMQGNAIYAIKNNMVDVSFQTKDIDLGEVFDRLADQLEVARKHEKYYGKEAKKNKFQTVAMLFTAGIGFGTVGVVGAALFGAAEYKANKGFKKKYEKNTIKLLYYFYILIATNMRSRELGKEFGYEW